MSGVGLLPCVPLRDVSAGLLRACSLERARTRARRTSRRLEQVPNRGVCRTSRAGVSAMTRMEPVHATLLPSSVKP